MRERRRALDQPYLFHPDSNRRLRSHTGSADPPTEIGGARGLGVAASPPVGNSTPP